MTVPTLAENQTAEAKLIQFASHLLLEYWSHPLDVDDVTIERHAVASGCLVEIVAAEPCGPACICAIAGSRFPAPCLTHPDDVRALLRAFAAQCADTLTTRSPDGAPPTSKSDAIACMITAAGRIVVADPQPARIGTRGEA